MEPEPGPCFLSNRATFSVACIANFTAPCRPCSQSLHALTILNMLKSKDSSARDPTFRGHP